MAGQFLPPYKTSAACAAPGHLHPRSAPWKWCKCHLLVSCDLFAFPSQQRHTHWSCVLLLAMLFTLELCGKNVWRLNLKMSQTPSRKTGLESERLFVSCECFSSLNVNALCCAHWHFLSNELIFLQDHTAHQHCRQSHFYMSPSIDLYAEKNPP